MDIKVLDNFIRNKANLWIDYGKNNDGLINGAVVNAILTEYKHLLDFIELQENKEKTALKDKNMDDWGNYNE